MTNAIQIHNANCASLRGLLADLNECWAPDYFTPPSAAIADLDKIIDLATNVLAHAQTQRAGFIAQHNLESTHV